MITTQVEDIYKNILSTKVEKKWIFLYLVYNSNYYDIPTIDAMGKVQQLGMQNQFEYLVKEIESVDYNKNIEILILESKIDVTKNLEIIRLHKKNSDGKVINFDISQSNDPLFNFNDNDKIGEILSKVLAIYKYDNLSVITYGHGSAFGINWSSIEANTTLNENDKDAVINTIVKEVSKNTPTSIKQQYQNYINNAIIFFNTKYKKVNAAFKTNFKTIEGNIKSKQYKLAFKKYPQKIKSVKNNSIAVLNKYFFARKIKNIHLANTVGQFDEYEKLLKIQILSNSEIANVLKTNKDIKVNILVMYNCVMQNLFTQYELKDTIEYFVAPSTGIRLPGYNYSYIFREFNKNINISTADLAKLFVDSVKHPFAVHNGFTIDNSVVQNWVIQSVKIDKGLLEEIQNGIKDWMEEFLVVYNIGDKTSSYLTGNYKSAYLNSINFSQKSVSNIKVFELYEFIAHFYDSCSINNNLKNSKITTISNNLKVSLNKIDYYNFIGSNFNISNAAITNTNNKQFPYIKSTGFIMPYIKPVSSYLHLIFSTNTIGLSPSIFAKTKSIDFFKTIWRINN